jgi:tetratricopeptide (TPR) repeat protein
VTESRDDTIERLFHEALERPPEERTRFVEENAPDPAIREDVLALLAADAQPAAPLRASPDELAAAVGLLPPPLAGRTIGPYRILEAIGQGGMGAVYRAVREDVGLQVALKVVRGALGDPLRLARFRQEQRLLARLEHRHIARLLDAGVADDGTPYLVMEYVEGEPITDWCNARNLDVEARLRLFLDVCDAVAFAHRHSIVHRDLKPSNVLVTRDGEVKLLDFGIAKLLEGDELDAGLTATGVRPLSPAYAAPEQLLGEPITTATDVYGLGALLYELLADCRARSTSAADPISLVAALDADIPAPSVAARNAGPPAADRARRIAGDLDAICLRALEREPSRRYAAVELLRADIVRHLTGLPVQARRPTFRYRAAKFLRRNATGVAVAATLALLLVAGVAAIVWQAGQAERARAEAEELAGFLVGLFEASDPVETRGRTVTARELLEQGTRRAGQLRDRPEAQARLLEAMARAYLGLGDYPRADSLAQQALARERQLHRRPHPHLAAALGTLGHIRREQGREAEAESLLRQALDLRRSLLGERHELTTRSMLELSALLQQRGQFAEAEALARQALDARTASSGPDHEGIAEATEVLATILWLSGRDLQAAEVLYRQALALRERLWGPDDPGLHITLSPLSALLPLVGKAAEAETVARRALELRRRYYGENHPQTIHQLNNLARAIQMQGRPAEARPLYREMLRAYERLFPGDHPMVATALNNVSATFYEEGRLDSAEHYLRQALQMRIRLHGPTNVEVALLYHNLGNLLLLRGRLAAAEETLAEAYRQRAELYGPTNPVTLRTGAIYGDALAARGKLDEAEKLLREILEHQHSAGDQASTDAARTMAFLAGVLARRGSFAEAESLYLPALDVLRRRMPPTHPRRRELVESLARLYEAWGRPADAARLRQEEAAAAN